MFAADSLQPKHAAAFHELLAGSGDLEWIRPLSFKKLNLKQIAAFWKAVRTGKKRTH